MAKISAETIEDVVGVVKKAASEGEAESIAKSLKIDTKDVQKIVDGKAPKTLIKRVFETAGSTIRGLQGKLDEALNRPKPSPTAFPGALQEIPTQVDGTMATGRGGPLVPVPRPAPEPAGPTALERIGAKAAIGGGEPPRVPSEFTTEQIKSKGETGYQVSGQPGGPIVPARRSGAPMPLPENVEAEDIPAPAGALARVQQRVQDVQPQLPPPGRREETLRESLQETQPGMEQLPEYNLGIGPSKRTVTRAGLGVAGAGTAVAGYKLLGDKPLANQEGVGDTTRVAEVAGTPDVKAMTDKALPHLPDQAKEVIQNQVQKVLSIEERLDKELSSARARYNQELARKELLQAIETVMHGLVTALGAKAALDRGSPFAIDFSKGPQVNWESKFANLQKDFELQTNSIVKKYDLEQKERLEQQKAAESGRRYGERMALEREKLDVEKAKAGQQAAKQQAEELAKLNTEQQKQYNTNLKSFAALKEAVQNKKPGDVEQYATMLGADDATINQIKADMDKGLLDKVLEFINPGKAPEEVIQGLRPKKPTPAVDNMVTVTVNGQTGKIPKDQLEAFRKQYPNAEVQ